MTLTAQQVTCLRLAAEGHTGPEIAKKIHMSESTVKDHLSAARGALGARTTTQAVAIAVASGLIPCQPSTELSARVALVQVAHALGYDIVPARQMDEVVL
jgi:DNA-binding CsgD family transcriptional regulator